MRSVLSTLDPLKTLLLDDQMTHQVIKSTHFRTNCLFVDNFIRTVFAVVVSSLSRVVDPALLASRSNNRFRTSHSVLRVVFVLLPLSVWGSLIQSAPLPLFVLSSFFLYLHMLFLFTMYYLLLQDFLSQCMQFLALLFILLLSLNFFTSFLLFSQPDPLLFFLLPLSLLLRWH